MIFHRSARHSQLTLPLPGMRSPRETGRGTKGLVAPWLRAVAAALGIVAVACSLALAETTKPTDAPKRVRVARHQFAPIGKPYFFAWWGATAPSHKNFLDVLPVRHQTVECLMRKESDRDWWLGRGVWPFGWSWGTQGSAPFDSADKYEDYILKKARSGAVGVCFDEWVGFDAESQNLRGTPEKEKYPGNPKNRMLAEACRRVKRRYPDFFIAACTHMQSDALIEALQKGWVDLAIVESYPYVAGEPAWTPELAMWRLGNAKKAGVMEKTIPALWITPKDKTFTAEWIEGWIRTFRKEFPQMPGLAPFFPGGHDRAGPRTQRLARACDRLIRKYYIHPAPKVWIVTPEGGAVARGPVRIETGADKPVKTWRLYVGAKHLCDQADSVFTLTGLKPGPHVITVQAITADFLRGVEQIQIEVVASPRTEKQP